MSTNQRFTLDGKTYQVHFIAGGLGSSDYSIVQCGGGHNEIRVRIFDDRTLDGWWRMTEYDAPSILAEYFRLEREDYLRFCVRRGLHPDDAGMDWERLYRIA